MEPSLSHMFLWETDASFAFFVAIDPVATFLKRVNQYNLLTEKPNLEELLLWCWSPDKAEGYQSSQYY